MKKKAFALHIPFLPEKKKNIFQKLDTNLAYKAETSAFLYILKQKDYFLVISVSIKTLVNAKMEVLYAEKTENRELEDWANQKFNLNDFRACCISVGYYFPRLKRPVCQPLLSSLPFDTNNFFF